MGRARLLTSLIGSSALEPRVTALENWKVTTDASIGSINSALSSMNVALSSLDGRLDAVEAALAGSSGVTIQRFISGAEQYALLPVNGSRVAIYSLQLNDMQAGDVMLIEGQFEITNDLGYTVGIGRNILRASGPGGATATGGDILLPSLSAMDNVDVNRHHHIVNFSAHDVCPANGQFFYNVTAWAVSTGGSGNLAIENGYGRISAVRIRPN